MDSRTEFDFRKTEEYHTDCDRVLEMFEWTEAKAPEVIGTGGLEACTGVIIDDRNTRRAFIGHFVFPETIESDEFLETVNREYGDKLGLRVYLGGQTPDPVNGDYNENSKKEFIDRLRSIGFKDSQIHSEWAGISESMEMFIDTSSGRVTYEIEHDDNILHVQLLRNKNS